MGKPSDAPPSETPATVVIDDRSKANSPSPPRPARAARPKGPLSAADREAAAAAVAGGKVRHPRLGVAVGTCPECGLPVFAPVDSGHGPRHAPEEDPHRDINPALEIE